MGLTANINSSINKICQTIMVDQSLTARVLRMSNSSFYGRSKQVATLNEAIILLGFKTLRSLAVASSTHSMYQGVPDKAFREKLWEHTLEVALASRLIASAARHPQAEEAFIAGLMHDIGKLVLTQKLNDQYRKIIATVEQTGRSHIEVEKEILGFDHAEVGRLLLQKWAFPRLFVRAVAEHHDPRDEREYPLPLAFIVHLANHIAAPASAAPAIMSLPDLAELPSARALGFDAARLQEIQDTFAAQLAGEKELYRISESAPVNAAAIDA